MIQMTLVEYHSKTNWPSCAELSSSNIDCCDNATTTVTTHLVATVVMTTTPVP